MITIHNIPAGALPQDDRIEFIGDRKTRKVYFMQSGLTQPFSALSKKYRKLLIKEVINDPEAMNDLRGKGLSLSEALEEYAFCMYGSIDNKGDITNNKLANAENFRCSENCRCMRWRSKTISFNNIILTPREVQVIDALNSDNRNEVIATILNMSRSTLNTHKKNLFNKFNVLSTTALVSKAIEGKIIQ